MYLTDKQTNFVRQDHQDIELLLESYLTQIEEIANTVTRTSYNMRATEDIVNIILDTQRNSLLVFELKLAMGTLGLTGGALVAGVFGMNLKSGLETTDSAWIAMVGLATFIVGVIIASARRRMLKLIKRSL